MNFLNKLRTFFYGRYGVDALYYFLFVTAMLLWVVRVFVTNIIAGAVLFILEAALFAFALFRAFSRNIYARRKENDRFLGIFRGTKNFFVLQIDRIKYIKKYRFRKCPKCKAILRLPVKSGSHTVNCPKCGNKFNVKVIF